MATELVEAVRATCAKPEFKEAARLADLNKVEAIENVRALGDLGLNRAFLPVSKGGEGQSALTMAQLMEEIAAVDASTATIWNMQLVSLMFLSLIPAFPKLEEALSDMRDNNTMICGGLSAPLDQLDVSKAGFSFVADGDKFVVNGKGGFATGSEGAKYYFFLGRRVVTDGDAPAVFAVAEITDPGITVGNNWDATGLRATASNDMKLEDWVVPQSDVFEIPAQLFWDLLPQIPVELRHLREAPVAGIAGCMVGACRAIHDALIDHLIHRFGSMTQLLDGDVPTAHADEAWAKHRLGRLYSSLHATRLVVHDVAKKIDQHDQDNQVMTRLLALALFQAKSCVEESVIAANHLGGAHGYVAQSPLSRLSRDALGFNAMAWRLDELAILLGDAALDREIRIPGLGGT